jgi:hypothetical protein
VHRSPIILLTSLLLAAALVHRFYTLGGPYFVAPVTVQDHVWPQPFPSRDVLVLAAKAERLLPRGETVTAIEPAQAPNYDVTLYLAAAGVMPRHHLLPPKFDAKLDGGTALPRYVLAVREPFAHPSYRLLRELPEGRIYEVIR